MLTWWAESQGCDEEIKVIAFYHAIFVCAFFHFHFPHLQN